MILPSFLTFRGIKRAFCHDFSSFCPKMAAPKRKKNEWRFLAIITQFNRNLHIFYKLEKAPRRFFEIGAFLIQDSGRVGAFSGEALLRVNTVFLLE